MAVLFRQDGMVEFLSPFLSVLIVHGHVIADEVVLVIIEQVHIAGTPGGMETSLEIAGQIVYQYRLGRVDKYFLVLFIQYDAHDVGIFFGSLPFPVYFFYSFARFPVENEDVSVVGIVFYQYELVSNGHYSALRDEFIGRLQRNIFHIHNVLQRHFLFRIIRFHVHREEDAGLFGLSASLHAYSGQDK